MSSPPAEVFRCEDLAVTYRNGATALRGLSLTISRGERVAIVGESGCGKSTLVRAILGLLPPGTRVIGMASMGSSSQLIGMHERNLRKLRGSAIGYVPQNPLAAFDPIRSVGSQLAEAWRCHGRQVDRSFLVEQMTDVGVTDAGTLIDRRPSSWSGGMLQRASIVAATALRPLLVLADEPTSAVDRPLARRMLALLAERSDSLIAVTHDIDLVRGLFDRVVVLYAGKIVEDAEAERFLTSPRHPYSRSLVAAVPKPGVLPSELPGDPPSLLHPIEGCSFAPRCSSAAAICRTPPSLVAGVSCHFGQVQS